MEPAYVHVIWYCDGDWFLCFVLSNFDLSLVQSQPQHDHGQYVHRNDDAAHQHQVVGEIGLVVDHHVREEDAWILEVAVVQRRRFRTLEIAAIHSVHRVENAVKCGPKITEVPHPAKDGRDVHVARAETEHREDDGQNGTGEDGQLQKQKDK